jgi:hypothetical protein
MILKLKSISILLALCFFASQAFATAQYPDKIIYNGKEYSLHSNPLEDYFVKFPDQKPKGGLMSSALWRGYVATFEIADNSLFLKDIEIMVKKDESGKNFETGWKSVLKEVVPEPKKLKIDWFTGILVLPFGELVNYVHMGYGSTYENYILLEIAGGNFKKSREFNYKEYEKFKEKQFAAFKKTEEYKQLADDLKRRDPKTTDQFIDSFLKDFVINYSSKILVD